MMGGMDGRVVRAAELFKVLSTPVRLQVVHELTGGPRTVAELAEILEVSSTLMSQHLRVLRMAGLVDADADGRQRRYRIADQHVTHIVEDAIRHTEEG